MMGRSKSSPELIALQNREDFRNGSVLSTRKFLVRIFLLAKIKRKAIVGP